MNKKIKSFCLVVSLIVFFPLIISAQTEMSLSLFQEFTGEAANDVAGYSVSSAGDVNGDGYDDILIGAEGNSDAGSYAGAAYLIYGSSTPLTSASLSTAVKFTGEAANNYAGTSISSAGDVNHDGYDDILVGAYGNSDGDLNAGAAYLIYGSGTPLTSTSLSTAVEFTGEYADDLAGTSVSSAGDVNGDGYDDILIGIEYGGEFDFEGVAYLIYGSGTSLTSTSLSTAVEFYGEASLNYAGTSVSSAGDINNDGYDDILVGAYGNDDGGSDAGAAYLIYGQANEFSGLISLGTSGIAEFTGEAAYDYAGYSVSSAGDVNGDSYNDILVGAYNDNDGGSNAGATYLIYGSSTPLTSVSLSTAIKFIGEATDDNAGKFVSSAGDVNNDGYDDILVGALQNDDTGSDAGAAYLIYGSDTPLTSVSLSTAVEFTGEAAGDYAATSVASAGDTNNDGYNDILIGALQNDDGGSNAGAAYLGYPYIDSDHDGVAGTTGLFSGTDCNDADATVSANQTYYEDADADGYGNDINTTSVCSSTAPAGYSIYNTDCNDSDATVSANQTYYEDADGDGLGNPNETASVCSSTPPAGYVTNSDDLNDIIKDILSVVGATNGDILIAYINNDIDVIDVFNYTTTKSTIISQFNDQYYIALSTNGKKIALVDIISKTVLSTKTLSKKAKYTANTLKLKTIRSKDIAVVISKKKSKVLLSVIRINTTTRQLSKKDQERITNKNIRTNKTKIKKNTIYLKNKNAKTLEKYLVTKKFKLKIK